MLLWIHQWYTWRITRYILAERKVLRFVFVLLACPLCDSAHRLTVTVSDCHWVALTGWQLSGCSVAVLLSRLVAVVLLVYGSQLFSALTYKLRRSLTSQSHAIHIEYSLESHQRPYNFRLFPILNFPLYVSMHMLDESRLSSNWLQLTSLFPVSKASQTTSTTLKL
jgi:hypothetical protein